jgi:hypothetical protein
VGEGQIDKTEYVEDTLGNDVERVKSGSMTGYGCWE